ncbi:hypothetical protein HOK021_01270 [Streptomyces hygroscopicus]|nr:hypothetical protein HOK021_01270 [Streptomyces hygroscopicus]
MAASIPTGAGADPGRIRPGARPAACAPPSRSGLPGGPLTSAVHSPYYAGRWVGWPTDASDGAGSYGPREEAR